MNCRSWGGKRAFPAKTKYNRTSRATGAVECSRTIAATALTAILSVPHPATAEDAATTQNAAGNGPALEEVVVTAQKRATNLQDTPLAITAISGDKLQSEQVKTIGDLTALVPTLKFGTAESAAQVTLRGVGNASQNIGDQTPVAVNYNEVFVSRPSVLAGGMFDISNIEVLYGPQGTLYGRNATAGAINITTARPTDTWSGFVRAAVGNYDALSVEGAIGGPLIENKLLVRVAAFSDKHNGYGTNLVTGDAIDNRDAKGVRGTVVFRPIQQLSLTLIAEGYHQDDLSGGEHFFGYTTGIPGAYTGTPPGVYPYLGIIPANVRDLGNLMNPRFVLNYTALTGIAEWSAGGPFSLRSITGYRTSKSSNINEIGAGNPNLYIVSVEPDHQLSEELQLHYDTERLHATLGGYYFTENDNALQDVVGSTRLTNLFQGIPGIPPVDSFTDVVELGGLERTTAYAVFGEAAIKITQQLSLIVGDRYSIQFNALDSHYLPAGTNFVPVIYNPADPFNSVAPLPPGVPYPTVKFVASTPKAGLQYQFTPDIMTYATYAKGFKSGGYNVNQPTLPGGVFQPETIEDVEAGIKTSALDRTLRTDLSLFHYKYSNLQVSEVVGQSQIIENAASAILYGGELNVAYRPNTHWDFRLAGSYLYSNYTNYSGASNLYSSVQGNVSFTDHRLDNAPHFTGHLDATYHFRYLNGDVSLHGQADYSSMFFFSPENYPTISQGGNLKENAFATYHSDTDWSVTAFIRNISDQTTKTTELITAGVVAQALTGTLDPPRTFGLELRYDF